MSIDNNDDYRRETWRLNQVVAGLSTQVTLLSNQIEKIQSALGVSDKTFTSYEMDQVQRHSSIINRIERLEESATAILSGDEQRFLKDNFDLIRMAVIWHKERSEVRLFLTDKEIEVLRDFVAEKNKVTQDRDDFLRGIKVAIAGFVFSGLIIGVIVPLVSHFLR